MKQWIVVSGKGGTGKTSVTAAFAVLADDIVLADCDVDAADLHLIANPKINQTHDFVAGHTAAIDLSRCNGCGLCSELCAFDAINSDTENGYMIDPLACEGCLVCHQFCPNNAVDISPDKCGQWYQSETRFGQMVHAHLYPGSENSGKLVACVRENAEKIAKSENIDHVLIDGPPGIGCPVISSLSGVDLAIVVTEPSPSGRHDLQRIIDLTQFLKIPVSVVINKWDLNPEYTQTMERELDAAGISVCGRIRYDPVVYQALVNGQSIVEFTDEGASRDIQSIWNTVKMNY